jgi:TusE/DsrC/DsvC family sulfur relay protein
MGIFNYNNKEYSVDDLSYLIDFNKWDKDFVECMAITLSIEDGLNQKHWEVINCIRDRYINTALCPLVYETCKATKLHLKELRTLFPTKS